jgi:hypothetical protein
MDLEHLLAVVLRYGRQRGLTAEQIVTAQSLAWYHASRYEGDPLPASHWARLAVRSTLNGRDLPGCWTSPTDAIHRAWQGCGMHEVRDGSPGPDVLAEHREQYERALSESQQMRRVAELRVAGLSNLDVARELGVSPARSSQIARRIAEEFRR